MPEWPLQYGETLFFYLVPKLFTIVSKVYTALQESGRGKIKLITLVKQLQQTVYLLI